MKKPIGQPEVNIGVVGHVDMGKTTLVQAITGVWTDRHSEEIKRGITIKLGYADVTIYKCPNCPPPQCYTTKKLCKYCGSETEPQRTVSFVDAPGHEILMATTLSGAALMDGALMVIAANEDCPQPQTREHMLALQIVGVENIVVVQNKIELVSKEQALRNYKQIVDFLKSRGLDPSKIPIIPASAILKINIDYILEAIEKFIPTPERDPNLPFEMYVARSFDINKPGTPLDELAGGVVGGSILQGKVKVGDTVVVRPGVFYKGEFKELEAEVLSIQTGGQNVEEATPGGLVGIELSIDPSLTKGDRLVGNVLTHPENALPIVNELTVETHLFEQVVGVKVPIKVDRIKVNEPLMLTVGTATTVGLCTDIKGDLIHIHLKRPVCFKEGQRIAISRNIEGSWRLIGYGICRGE